VIRQQEQVEALPDFVAHAPKGFQLPVGRRIRRIIEAPMNGFGTWKYWTRLFCAIADRDDIVEFATSGL
jgi:hypothetical protein